MPNNGQISKLALVQVSDLQNELKKSNFSKTEIVKALAECPVHFANRCDYQLWILQGGFFFILFNRFLILLNLTLKGVHQITINDALGSTWFGAGLTRSLRAHADFLLSEGVISQVSSNYGQSINHT